MPILESITLKSFKEVLAKSQKARGKSIILGCYRRNGELKPTEQEIKIVQKAERMSERMGIQFADVLFLGEDDKYFSFWDARLLESSKNIWSNLCDIVLITENYDD